MTIEKLKSGSYRIKQMINGTTYRITVDHKPSNKEALQLIAKQMSVKCPVSSKMPLKRACEAYVESKSNVLSPSSIRGYNSLIKQISEQLSATPINTITRPMVQTEINKYSADHSPKTTANLSGFISSVLAYYGNEIGKITLPQKEKKSPYIPTEQEVHAILDAVKNTKYMIPIFLTGMGLRRSEVCALQIEDLSDDNVLTINKALVQNEKKEWVVKTTKTTDSTRTIIIPDYIANRIREQGYVYDGFPGQIYKRLTDTQKKLGIPHFSLHKMRHFFASYMHKLGYTDKQIQEMGGWKTDEVMRTVYQHAMDMEEAKKKMSSNFGSLIG